MHLQLVTRHRCPMADVKKLFARSPQPCYNASVAGPQHALACGECRAYT